MLHFINFRVKGALFKFLLIFCGLGSFYVLNQFNIGLKELRRSLRFLLFQNITLLFSTIIIKFEISFI